MTRGQCTSGTHRPSPTKGHFSRFRKCNNKIHETYKIHENKNGKLGKTGQQRNRFQTKEQDKAPEEELNKVGIGSLPNKEFKVMIVKTIKKQKQKQKNPDKKTR